MAEQDQRFRRGQIGADQLLAGQLVGLSEEAVDRLEINEDRLGFDSLALLELILATNRFFQLHRTGIEDYLLVHRDVGAWIDLIEKHHQMVGDDLAFGFATSGSVGTPKSVLHSAADLWIEIRAQIAGPFADLPETGRILSLVPAHHIYGFLFGCVLPDFLQREMIDLHRSGPTAAFRTARTGDLVIGTPVHWEHLGASRLRFDEGVFGVTSAGASTRATWCSAETANLFRLTEIFGSTETGGLGSRTGPDEDFTLLRHLSCQKDAVIRDHDQALLPLQDQLEWKKARQFRVCGRIDKSVKVAGVNVSPAQIERLILQLPEIKAVAVRPGAQRLKFFVVPRDPIIDTDWLGNAIRTHLRNTAVAAALPESITFGPDIPRNAMGKNQDWPVAVSETAVAEDGPNKLSDLPFN